MTMGNASVDNIKRDQAAHHRGTLTANKRTARTRPSSSFKKKERSIEGHERLLKMLQDDGRSAMFSLLTGQVIHAQVSSFDRYTVTLRARIDDTMRSVCLYKHAISYFLEITDDELSAVASGDEGSGE